jgi:hypothetical protein
VEKFSGRGSAELGVRGGLCPTNNRIKTIKKEERFALHFKSKKFKNSY